MTEKLPNLTDTQIALIIKNALDHNAGIIRYASFIYGQDAKPSTKRRWINDLIKMTEIYTQEINRIVDFEEKND